VQTLQLNTRLSNKSWVSKFILISCVFLTKKLARR
jgi:hypothetical protein